MCHIHSQCRVVIPRTLFLFCFFFGCFFLSAASVCPFCSLTPTWHLPPRNCLSLVSFSPFWSECCIIPTFYPTFHLSIVFVQAFSKVHQTRCQDFCTLSLAGGRETDVQRLKFGCVEEIFIFQGWCVTRSFNTGIRWMTLISHATAAYLWKTNIYACCEHYAADIVFS